MMAPNPDAGGTNMTGRTFAIGVSACLAAVVALTPVSTAWSADPPVMRVSRITGLAGGDTVQVAARGLTPNAGVRIVQCDTFDPDGDSNCSDNQTLTADSAGRILAPVTLLDPVWRSEPFGDGVPVYCRADGCHLFVVWTDGTDTTRFLSSRALTFRGSPATISATPSQDLPPVRKVQVTGTAMGASGHTVGVFEGACFAIVQGSGCYGQLPTRFTTVRTDGTYELRYRVHRYLADGTDCTDPDMLGSCRLVAVVFSHGQPDDSFGVSRIGDPGAPLAFQG